VSDRGERSRGARRSVAAGPRGAIECRHYICDRGGRSSERGAGDFIAWRIARHKANIRGGAAIRRRCVIALVCRILRRPQTSVRRSEMQFKIPNFIWVGVSVCALPFALVTSACDDPDAVAVRDLDIEELEPDADAQDEEAADRSAVPEEAASHHGGWHGGHHGGWNGWHGGHHGGWHGWHGHHGGWHGGHHGGWHGGHHGGWHGGHGGWHGGDGGWDGDGDGGWDGDGDGGWNGDGDGGWNGDGDGGWNGDGDGGN
jgi:hypothetical protein